MQKTRESTSRIVVRAFRAQKKTETRVKEDSTADTFHAALQSPRMFRQINTLALRRIRALGNAKRKYCSFTAVSPHSCVDLKRRRNPKDERKNEHEEKWRDGMKRRKRASVS